MLELGLMQALETAGQVGSVHPPSGPLSYSATASQCEAAGAGTHKKMSAVLKLDSKGGPLMITLPNKEDPHSNSNGHDSSEARVSSQHDTSCLMLNGSRDWWDERELRLFYYNIACSCDQFILEQNPLVEE